MQTWRICKKIEMPPAAKAQSTTILLDNCNDDGGPPLPSPSTLYGAEHGLILLDCNPIPRGQIEDRKRM
eukprot:scaffold38558_cov55-Cyclotella_meneghiniana.AAC.8